MSTNELDISMARNGVECVPSCSTWPPSWMAPPDLNGGYEFAERAAIMEFDGGLSRYEAERRTRLRRNRSVRLARSLPEMQDAGIVANLGWQLAVPAMRSACRCPAIAGTSGAAKINPHSFSQDER